MSLAVILFRKKDKTVELVFQDEKPLKKEIKHFKIY